MFPHHPSSDQRAHSPTISTHSAPPTDHVVRPAVPAAAVPALAAAHTPPVHSDNSLAKSDYSPYSGSAADPAAVAVGHIPEVNLTADFHPTAAVAAVVAAAVPTADAAAAVVAAQAEARRTAGARAARRGCIESVERGYRMRYARVGIGVGLRRIGMIRGVGEEVVGSRWRGRRRRTVGETCTVAGLVL